MLRKLAIAIAASGAMMSASSTYALGMGDIELDSALNQPLNARIKLLKASELEDWEIKPNLASPDEFQKSGVEHVFFLNSLKFVVERVDGETFVNVVSDQPVVEPFLNFLVQVDWPSGRLLREYTLLLDPPVFAQDEQVVDLDPAESDNKFDSESDQNMPAAPAVQASDISDIPDFEAQPSDELMADETADLGESENIESSTQVMPAAPVSRTYQVKANDTLWEVAVRTRGNRNISPQQAMLAIQDLNPDAFINGNINRLKKNQTLEVPTDAQMFSRTFKQAVAEVAQQNNAFAARKAQLDATRKNSVIERDSVVSGAELKLLAGGSATAMGERGATGEVASAAAGDQSSLAQDLSLALENLDKSSRENTELRSRLDALEEQISTLQRLINLKDEQMVALQSGMGAADVTDTPAVLAVEEVIPEATDDLSEAGVENEVDEGSLVAKPVADLNFASNEAKPEEKSVEQTKPKPKFVYQPEEIVEEPFDPVAFAIENPPILLGALASLLLALFGIKYSRKKKEEAAEKNSDVVENDFAAHDPLDHVDAEIEGDFDDEFSDLDLADDAGDTNFEAADLDDFESPDMGLPESLDDSDHESSDVLGEVDVYLAYNRMDPARDLLEKTLISQPGRMDLRLKLLEVLSEMDNEDAFSEQFDYIASQGSESDKAQAAKLQSSFNTESDSGDLSLDSLADFDSGSSDFGLDLEDNELNFDLDGLDLTTEEEILQPTLSEDSSSLDFELDMDEGLVKLDSDEGLLQSSDDDFDSNDLDFDSNDLDFELDASGLSDELDGSDLESELSFNSDSLSDGNAVSFELNETESDLEFEIPELSESVSNDLEVGELDTDDFDIELSSVAESKQSDGLAELGSLDEADELEIELNEFASLDLDEDTDEVPSLGLSDLDDELSFEGSEIPELDENLELDGDLESNVLSDLDALDAQLASEDDAELDLSLPDFESEASLDVPGDLDSLDTHLAEQQEPFSESLPSLDGDVDLDDLEGDLDFLSGTDESETKLDLARAYIDMDDQEGAREILQEVLDDGTDTQKQEANKLLDSLA